MNSNSEFKEIPRRTPKSITDEEEKANVKDFFKVLKNHSSIFIKFHSILKFYY